MRIKVVLFLALLSGILFLCLRKPDGSKLSNNLPTGPSPAAAAGHDKGDVDHGSTATASAGPAAPVLSPGAQWEQPAAEPSFAAFKEWTQRYRQANSAEARAALEPEGVELARARLTAMAGLIQSNPERALELAVPGGVRRELPGSVNALLEEEVFARGDYQVLAVMPQPGSAVQMPPVVRAAVINGEQHEVFTYGAALGYVTKRNVPMSGVAVPVNVAATPPTHQLIQRTKLMALREHPIRILEQQELKALLTKKPVCSISGQAGVVGASSIPSAPIGDLTSEAPGLAPEVFCGPAHLKQWAASGNAGLSTPDGAGLPTAESSYTEGRKRMLLMRPVWSNYTGGMTTNDALSHYMSFSNYMFEMSHGKIVLAALGKGSEITPPMTLPGLVADYDNTGLGLLYNTCRDVARTTFGYDLTDFDFTYVCTGGAPAANYAGLAFVGGVGFHMANSSWGSAVTSHEFGHNLGLNHAHFWDTGARSIIGDGQNIEYGDNNDPMGGGGSPNTYNSRYQNYLGWIHDTDIANLNATGSGTYRLYCFDLDTSVGLRGLKFARSASQNYWLNFRQRKTSKKALMNGVQLLWTGNGSEGSFLLDVRLKGDADDNAIVIGRTFSDTSLGFHVTPMRKGHTFPESVDVQVNLGSFPGNQPPIVLVSASPAAANPAQAITFTAAASDPNGDTLAYSWDFGDGDYSVDNSPMTTHAYASAGEYAVQCTASDMKGGTARHTVIVRVGNPAVFRISGRVLDQQSRPMSGIRVSTSAGQTAFTDSDGGYTIPGLPAGSYDLSAIEPVTGGFTFVHPAFVNPVAVGPSRTAIDFVGVPGTLDIYTPLVAKSAASWRYLDNGSDQGTAWQAPGFNDASWSTGTAPLGYPSGSPISTVIGFGPDSNNKHITYYFRRAFNVPDPNAYTNLLLQVLRDDSAVVYLNGTEVFRDNLPSGTINYTTRAVDNSGASSYLSATLSRSLLTPGVNYLVGEVHQVSPTSSDVVFDAALSGLSVSNATGFKYLYVSSPANNSSFTNPPTIPISATAFSGAGAITLVEFFVDGVKLGEDPTAPYQFPWSSPATGTHLLTTVATIAGSGSITSAPVSVTIVAPAVLSISMTSPINGTNVVVPVDLPVNVTVTTGASPLSSVRYYIDGTFFSIGGASPFGLFLAQTVPGVRTLTAVATDTAGNSVTSAPVNVTFTQPDPGLQLISFGDVWKYLDDGTDQGTAWRQPGFDDRLWAAGPTRIGYGGDGEITLISSGPNVNQRYITTYFRKTFNVLDPGALSGLALRLARDDGAVVYLNGTEVFRDNLLSGPVNWNSLAVSTIDGISETTPVQVNLGTANLVAGANVIAVEVHQVAITSSDVGFDLSLAGRQTPGAAQMIYLTEPGQGARFHGPTNISLASYGVSGGELPSTVAYYANGSLLGIAPAVAPFSFVWNNAPIGSHEVTAVAVWNGGASATSAPVNIVVSTPPARIQPVTVGLINAGLTWRYWDNVTPVTAGWQTRGFNDSTWPVGTARFGWGLDGEITTLTEGRITHYFRRWFNIPQPALLTELVFQLARDDGAVVYLNGVEIFRSNMPDGVVTASTLAATTINTPDETIFVQHVLQTAGSGLVTGTNLVAVEIHQSAATSSDGGFDLQLAGYGTTEARVYLTTPNDGRSYSGSPVINLEAFAKGAGTALVTNVEFFANGNKLGESAASPWQFAWTNAPIGFHSLTARSTDSGGLTVESAPVLISIGRERITTTLISSNSVWKYLDTGVNQGTAWTAPAFNDTTWRSGPARLGFGGDGEATVVNGGPSSARFPTIYFRKTFVVPSGAVYTNLQFKIARDDGAVIHLNGTEVFRSNMPLGPVSYSTLANAADDEQTFFPTSIAVSGLAAGTNTLAVEVHQSSATSSDLGFNLELTAAGYEDDSTPPLLAVTLEDGSVELRWPATAIGWRVYSATLVNTPNNGWAQVLGPTSTVGGQNVMTVPPAGSRRFFRLGRP